jgi:HEAT repeat protein/beta-lactamase regulating signal transducer with metallopeptidase domain
MTSILSQLSLTSVPAALPVLLFLGKATLLLLLAIFGATALRRSSAGARHIVWTGALAAIVLLPVLSRWTPWRLAVFPSSLGVATGALARSDGPHSARPGTFTDASTPGLRTAAHDEPQVALAQSQDDASAIARSGSVERAPSRDTQQATQPAPMESRAGAPHTGLLDGFSAKDIWAFIAACWAIGTLILLARLLLGMISVARIVRGARPLESHEWTTPLWEVADRLDLAHTPRLLCSDAVSMPFACGLLDPAVVLPSDADGWSDDRRRAVLFHELAHVRRRDLFGHTLGRIACAFYWFHPLVWAAARRMRSESERACDDLVLTSGTLASEYAHHLLEIVTGVRNASAPVTALAMARRKEFEGRMLAILDPDQRRGAPGRLQSAALAIGLAALTLSVSAMAPAASHRAGSIMEMANAAHDPATAPDSTASRSAAVVDTTTSATSSERHDAATAPDTGEDAHSSEVRRMANSSVERSVERAAEEAAAMATRSTYSDLMSDWNGSAPRLGAHALDGVNDAIRASVRESFGERARGDAASLPDDSGTTDLLVKLLESDSDAKVRRTAAWALAQRDKRDSRVVTEALEAALARDKSADVREMAAWGLGQSESETAGQALRNAVQHDADERVKATAAWALGTIGDAAAAASLDSAMADPSARVRARAAWALGQIEPEKAPRGLVSALGDSSDKVRLAAAWALGQIGDPGTLAALSQALSTEKDHDIRDAELRALIMLGEASDATLQKLLESPDPDVRLKVTRAIVGFRGVRPWPWPMPMPRPMP